MNDSPRGNGSRNASRSPVAEDSSPGNGTEWPNVGASGGGWWGGFRWCADDELCGRVWGGLKSLAHAVATRSMETEKVNPTRHTVKLAVNLCCVPCANTAHHGCGAFRLAFAYVLILGFR